MKNQIGTTADDRATKVKQHQESSSKSACIRSPSNDKNTQNQKR